MDKKIILTLILGIFLITLVSASLDDLGTFKQNDCINISQTCATCSYVNISSVSNKDNSTLISNVEMEDFGNGEWRYEFCSTSDLGRYDVRGMGDVNSIDTSFATYFEVTPTGTTQNSFLNNPVLIILILLSLVFLGLGVGFKLSSLGFIGSILLVLSGIYTMIYGFNNVTDLYTRGVAIALLGLGIIFMIVSAYEWLPWGKE